MDLYLGRISDLDEAVVVVECGVDSTLSPDHHIEKPEYLLLRVSETFTT